MVNHHLLRALQDAAASGSNTSTGQTLFAKIASYFFSGLGAILGMLLVIYLSMLILDKCGSVQDIWPTQSAVTNNNAASVSSALQWDLTRKERKAVLEHLFQHAIVTYDEENPNDSLSNLSIQEDEGIQDPESTAEITPTRRDSSNSNEAAAALVLDSAAAALDEGGDIELADLNNTSTLSLMSNANAACCSICLEKYRTGDTLLRAPLCQHAFHADCCQTWLLQQQTDCPYCRKPMVTPTEFRKAATQVLSPARISELQQEQEPQQPSSAQVVAGTTETAPVVAATAETAPVEASSDDPEPTSAADS